MSLIKVIMIQKVFMVIELIPFALCVVNMNFFNILGCPFFEKKELAKTDIIPNSSLNDLLLFGIYSIHLFFLISINSNFCVGVAILFVFANNIHLFLLISKYSHVLSELNPQPINIRFLLNLSIHIPEYSLGLFILHNFINFFVLKLYISQDILLLPLPPHNIILSVSIKTVDNAHRESLFISFLTSFIHCNLSLSSLFVNFNISKLYEPIDTTPYILNATLMTHYSMMVIYNNKLNFHQKYMLNHFYMSIL